MFDMIDILTKKHNTLTFIAYCAALSSCSRSVEQPNILLIVADDAGYNDFGFMGSKDILTPNLDSLAASGVVFSDAHVSATVSGPSRAGILTGRYQERFGYECNQGPDNTVYLPVGEQTIADVLKDSGYSTACIGKWHLGATEEYHPNNRGFDYFFGFLSGGRSYFKSPDKDDKKCSPSNILENNDYYDIKDWYLTDLLGQKAVDFIDGNNDKPFFMYLSFNAVHTPMQASEEDLARFKGHPRKKLAAMTWAMDRAIGNVVNELKRKDIYENTLIIFLSDNGGAHNNQSSNFPLKGFKGNNFEGGHRVPFFIVWPEKIHKGTFDGMVSSLDIFPTCLAASGADCSNCKNSVDGENLLDYLCKSCKRDVHKSLYWRKEDAAAVRHGDYVMLMIRDSICALYDLRKDLSQYYNLLDGDMMVEHSLIRDSLKSMYDIWEKDMGVPLWSEGFAWNEVTNEIHEALIENAPIRRYTPKSK